MGDLIDFNPKPKTIELGGRKERMEKRTKEIRNEFERLKRERKKHKKIK